MTNNLFSMWKDYEEAVFQEFKRVLHFKNVVIKKNIYVVGKDSGVKRQIDVSFSHEGQSKEAMTCFLIAWRLYDGDLEALVNAFIESYNSMEESKTALILTVIRELAPEEGYKMIVSILVSNNNGNSNFNLFIDALKKVFFQNDVIACIN